MDCFLALMSLLSISPPLHDGFTADFLDALNQRLKTARSGTSSKVMVGGREWCPYSLPFRCFSSKPNAALTLIDLSLSRPPLAPPPVDDARARFAPFNSCIFNLLRLIKTSPPRMQTSITAPMIATAQPGISWCSESPPLGSCGPSLLPPALPLVPVPDPGDSRLRGKQTLTRRCEEARRL